MPEFTLEVPVLGNRWAVGLTFQVHLVMVAAIMGGAVVAPLAEIVGLRRADPRWERLAHDITSAMVRFFSFAATWAVVALLLLVALYPALMGALFSVFLWPLILVAVAWLFMTVGAYSYYYSWERLRQRRALHVAFGLMFAISAFIFIDLITLLSSFQLTPVEPTSLLAVALGSSWPTEVLHRHVGNLSYFGFIAAGTAGVAALFGRRAENRAYYDWLGHLGLLLGLSFGLLQPLLGYFYANRMGPEALDRAMRGEVSGLFWLQSALLGLVFLLGNLYMGSAATSRGQPGARAAAWLRWSTLAVLLLALLLIVPRGWPLGNMSPWKYLALAGLVGVSGVTLVVYLLQSRRFVWGRAGRFSHLSLLGLAGAIVALLVTMGVIREAARGADLITDRLPDTQAQNYQVE
ncbi:MAG: cytochrome ubiquinol oxidase subunit I [Chloroflexota bacterium]